MFRRNSSNTAALILGISLSLGLHAALFCCKGLRADTEAELTFAKGDTVVHLTLAPSIEARKAPEPQPAEPIETPPEPEQPDPPPQPDPKPIPEEPPEPVVDPDIVKPIPVPDITPPTPPVETPPLEMPPETPPVKQKTESKPEPPAEELPPAPVDSIERDGSIGTEQGVSTPAQTSGIFRPTYPRISRRLGEQGTIVLTIEILPDGMAEKVEVTQSTGFQRLDNAALKAVRKTRFVPATRRGKNIRSTMTLSYIFTLQGGGVQTPAATKPKAATGGADNPPPEKAKKKSLVKRLFGR